MTSILEMLAQRASDDNAKPRMSKIGQVARLREFAALYSAPNPFKVGDLVTPRANSPIKDAGDPHLVVEVLDTPRWVYEGTPYSSTFGLRMTIRIAQVGDHGAACYWGEHHNYELYTGDGSRPGDLQAEAA